MCWAIAHSFFVTASAKKTRTNGPQMQNYRKRHLKQHIGNWNEQQKCMKSYRRQGEVSTETDVP